MAKLENKNINPMVAAIANFCCLHALGTFLLGQVNKGIFCFLFSLAICFSLGMINFIIGLIPFVGFAVLLTGPLSGLVGLALGVLNAMDAHAVATAVQNGEEVDENEFKNEWLYKGVKIIFKDAVYTGAEGSQAADDAPQAADDSDQDASS